MSKFSSASIAPEQRLEKTFLFPENLQTAGASLGIAQAKDIRYPEDIYIASTALAVEVAAPTQVRRRRLTI